MSGNNNQRQSEQAQHIAVEIPRERKSIYLSLYRAALHGDWKTAKGIFDEFPRYKSENISKRNETALHIAAAANCNDFAKQLVKMMEPEDLAMKNVNDNTAFFLTAASGNVELAKEMLKKNSELAKIRGSKNVSPLYMAAVYGHRDMVSYLYDATKEELKNEKYCFRVLIALLKCNLYAHASQMLVDYPDITAKLGNGQKALELQKALQLLAQRPQRYSCFDKENEQGIWKRCIKIFSGNNVVRNKLSEEQAHIRRILRHIIMSDNVLIQEKIGQLVFVAAKQGNVEFLTMLIRLHPDLIWKFDDDKGSIFHIAVQHRHEDIFKLIYEIGSIKDLINTTFIDKETGNNMLHMAGLLAPANRLNIVPGAALQMQRELLWFQEVKKIMPPLKAEIENNDHHTPEALFTEKHKDLMKEGEKWMRDTANSCMLVATLIATVVFAAAFTVPGGNKDQTGIPLFIESISFQIFAVSDAISLIFSCTSILVFLSILTSRYTEEDFLWLLPNKLIIGLATLLISIAAMMVSFTATFFIVFHNGLPHFAIAVAAIASIPVILFVVLHMRLFRDIIRLTYMSKSMFQIKKRTLFSKED